MNFSKTTVFLLWILVVYILLGYTQSIEAQSVKTNERILIDEIKQALVTHQLLLTLDTSFRLDTNFPDHITTNLNRYLSENGFRVRANDENPAIQLRFFSNNSLIQLRRNEIERTLGGELNLFLINENAEIETSSTVEISFKDILSPYELESIESEWIATQFAERQLNERSRWRSIGQPAILAAATGVTVFLLFNVRS